APQPRLYLVLPAVPPGQVGEPVGVEGVDHLRPVRPQLEPVGRGQVPDVPGHLPHLRLVGAELLRQVGEDRLPYPGGERRVELEAAPHHLDLGRDVGQRPLQPPLAQVTPGAHDVGPHLYPHLALPARVPSPPSCPGPAAGGHLGRGRSGGRKPAEVHGAGSGTGPGRTRRGRDRPGRVRRRGGAGSRPATATGGPGTRTPASRRSAPRGGGHWRTPGTRGRACTTGPRRRPGPGRTPAAGSCPRATPSRPPRAARPAGPAPTARPRSA